MNNGKKILLTFLREALYDINNGLTYCLRAANELGDQVLSAKFQKLREITREVVKYLDERTEDNG